MVNPTGHVHVLASEVIFYACKNQLKTRFWQLLTGTFMHVRSPNWLCVHTVLQSMSPYLSFILAPLAPKLRNVKLATNSKYVLIRYRSAEDITKCANVQNMHFFAPVVWFDPDMNKKVPKSDKLAKKCFHHITFGHRRVWRKSPFQTYVLV